MDQNYSLKRSSKVKPLPHPNRNNPSRLKGFLVEFTAEYYVQGIERGKFQRLVTAYDYEDACSRLRLQKTSDWEFGSLSNFKNLNIKI